MDKITETMQKSRNEINVANRAVLNPETCGDVTRVCDPENFFDMIEQCKICGKCV